MKQNQSSKLILEKNYQDNVNPVSDSTPELQLLQGSL
jgi:hypothetical protein